MTQTNNFKDFGIRTNLKPFTGDKISLQNIIGTKIKVSDYKIEPSKKKEGTELLTLQIEKSGDLRIVFTGSTYLIDQIRQVPRDKFPFYTTIVRVDNHCEFT